MRRMNTAEDHLFSAVDRDEFWQACQSCFSGQSGAVVLRALAALSHPLTPPVGKDALDTYRLIGRAEIVSLLLRYSEAQVTPAQLAQYHASQTERNAGGSGKDSCAICATCPFCKPDGDGRSGGGITTTCTTCTDPACRGCESPGCPAHGAGRAGGGITTDP